MTPHIYIVGQTASGKTGFSIDLCEKNDFEILNTDSLLFYRGLNIGTAKPTVSEQERVKHHLIDNCDVGEELSAADYRTKAKLILEDVKKPILCVGGSGFYIKALDVGLLPLPETNSEIRKEVAKIPNPVSVLKLIDPDFFNKISENDLYRVGRALEVYTQTGKTLSKWQAEFDPKPKVKKIAFDLDRAFLRQRVDQRVNEMFKEGFVEEVERLLKNPLAKGWKPLSSVGYDQVMRLLSGEISTEEEAREEIVHKTMQLSKRQKTWFKKDESVTWFGYNDMNKASDFVLENIEGDSWKV